MVDIMVDMTDTYGCRAQNTIVFPRFFGPKMSYRVVMDTIKGRGLFTNIDIPRGTVILEEEPLVSCQFAWNKTYGYLACDYCLKPLETVEQNVRRLLAGNDTVWPFPPTNMGEKVSIEKCEYCDETYCSVHCKNTAFEKYHKLLCFKRNSCHPLNTLLQSWMESHYPPETCNIMLIARIIALFELSTNKEAVLSQLTNFVQEPVNNLSDMTIPHRLLGDLYGEKLTYFRTEFEQYFSNIGNFPKWWNNNEAFQRIFVLLARNGQGIGTSPLKSWIDCYKSNLNPDEMKSFEVFLDELYEKLDEVSGSFLDNEGSGLFVTQSLCNHSCDPNSESRFPNNNFVLNLVATRDIAKDEEILISYLDECGLERSRHSRQKALMENYLFICKCTKCLDESSQPDVTSEEEEEEEDYDENENVEDEML